MQDNQLICEPGYREDSFVYSKGDGFYFHFSYDSNSTLYFVCASSRCPGRAQLRIGSVLEHTQNHNHLPDVLRSQFLYYRRNILNQVRSLTYVSFADIIHQERRRITNREIRSRLTIRSLRPAMQRARADIFPPVPSSLRGLTAIHQDPSWAHLTRTSDNLDSIYLGSVDATDGSHSIIYCSGRNLQRLREVNIIFGDGTFNITPAVENCYQVFTIVSISGHTVIPLLCCLMERKSEAAYVSVFLFLRTRLGNWNFVQVVCDFEDAMINAFRIVFGIQVVGCYFHYVNALGRWARMNITHQILCDFPQVLDIVTYCCALPLLPRTLLQQGFDVIVDEALELGLYLFLLCFSFLHYVQTDWINHVNRGQTLSVCGSAHRTNNASESNNKRMNRRLARAHPNVFHLLHEFVLFEDETVDDLNSLARGFIPTRHRPAVSISNDAYVTSLTSQLLRVPMPTDADILRFLRSAAFSVNNVVFSALGFENN